MRIYGRVLDLPAPPSLGSPTGEARDATVRPPATSTVPGRALGVRVLCALQFVLASTLTFAVVTDPPVDRLAAFVSSLTAPAPRPPGISIYSLWIDDVPVRVTVTAAWHKVPVRVATHTLRTDPTLWRRMHFDDFDKIRNPLREQVLDRLFVKYAYVLDGPWQWALMDAHDWDKVPQPMRAMAYVAMARYWSEAYPVAPDSGINRRLLGDTLATLVMVESWFDHRGTFTNAGGDRDIGLGAASQYCRATLERLYQKGQIPFQLDEEDYFNPWLATLAMAAWFDLAVGEAKGDVDLAVRTYHRGIDRARAGAAADYLRNVRAKRARFMRNRDASPTWAYLYARSFAPPPVPDLLFSEPAN